MTKYIQVGNEQIKVGLTKVLLDIGEIESLMTSLFDKKLKALYHMRWGVEE